MIFNLFTVSIFAAVFLLIAFGLSTPSRMDFEACHHANLLAATNTPKRKIVKILRERGKLDAKYWSSKSLESRKKNTFCQQSFLLNVVRLSLKHFVFPYCMGNNIDNYTNQLMGNIHMLIYK